MIKCDSKIKISTTDTNADAWRRGRRGRATAFGFAEISIKIL